MSKELTDDYDIYGAGFESTHSLSGTPIVDESGHIIDSNQGQLFTKYENSVFDNSAPLDNTGAMTDFWTDYPVIIADNGDLYYDNVFTGINVRGPKGITEVIGWADLSEDDKTKILSQLKGTDGIDGKNGANGDPGKPGVNGIDGKDGASAYEVWLEDNPQGTKEEFFQYLASIGSDIGKIGTGNHSIEIFNYKDNPPIASGDGSIAAGEGSIAQYTNQVVLGYFNENKNNTILEIGNGSAGSRSNIVEIREHELLVNGDIRDNQGNLLSNKVDAIQGKSLSSNDFTDEDKNNIQNAYDNAQQALNATTYITNTISVLSNSVSQFSKDVDNFKTEISNFEKVTNNSLKEFESKLNIIIDDVTNTKYKIGINDGHLYIQEFVEEATV